MARLDSRSNAPLSRYCPLTQASEQRSYRRVKCIQICHMSAGALFVVFVKVVSVRTKCKQETAKQPATDAGTTHQPANKLSAYHATKQQSAASQKVKQKAVGLSTAFLLGNKDFV